MFVGVARVVLQIPGARSLKDRRQVVKSFKDKVKSRLGISAAEVGETEKLQLATLGVSVVSNDPGVCHELLASVRSMAESLSDALLADIRTEVFSFGSGGRGLDPLSGLGKLPRSRQ